VLGWLASIAFCLWAARLLVLEGYLYVAAEQFTNGDFPRTANLGSPEFWSGQGIFYGPIFVLEWRYLLAPGLVPYAEFARLNFVLLALAFACTWLALFGPRRPRLALVTLGAWLAHHSMVEAFAYTSHLELLELTCLSAALWLAVRGRDGFAGTAFGLAIATKTLPGLYLVYLVLARRWRMALFASAVAAAFLLLVCAIQGIAPWDGAISLLYQNGNLTKMEFSEYEYSPRADFARAFAGASGVLTAEQAQLAIGLHFALSILSVVLAGWVVVRTSLGPRTYGLFFGLVATVMLIVSPSAHVHYYIFLVLAWTAMLAELLRRPRSPWSALLWGALAASYIFTGFDQPFFLANRLFGVGLVVPEHWLAWHLPTLALFLTGIAVSVLMLTGAPAGAAPSRSPQASRQTLYSRP
jgi:hypothetical protein